jgi:hypothetical protein
MPRIKYVEKIEIIFHSKKGTYKPLKAQFVRTQR